MLTALKSIGWLNETISGVPKRSIVRNVKITKEMNAKIIIIVPACERFVETSFVVGLGSKKNKSILYKYFHKQLRFYRDGTSNDWLSIRSP